VTVTLPHISCEALTNRVCTVLVMSDIVELCADTGLSSPAQSLAFWIALTFGVYVFISIVVSSVTIYVVSLEKKHK